LSEALVFGYPPIPLTREAHLLAARAEVNAIITAYPNTKVQFVVSATPRGGFSGGLAFSEYDFALGVISASLTKNDEAAELGFMAVISVEAIYECLAENKLLPEVQAKGWNDFWNTKNWIYIVDIHQGMSTQVANVGLFDDGKRVYVDLYCREAAAMSEGLRAAQSVASEKLAELTRSSEMHARITFEGDHDAELATAHKVVAAACAAMEALGYKPGALQGS
jgi:hypothetical protein